MTTRKKKKERIPERQHPGDPEPEWCSPGSIEQQLDMCETGSLRGDEILHRHGVEPPPDAGDPLALDESLNRSWEVDLSEENREGDEMSGDEHSSGLDGGDREIENQIHIHTGMPGDWTKHKDRA